MDLNLLQLKFEKKSKQYENLGKNVVESLKILLESTKIKSLSINFRIKEADSFLEKIERKSYQNPFEETEDICGIRIICYYQKDITKIEELVSKEFIIHESFNKETKLDYDQFGYRSHHLVASIKKEWEKTPNFRGLSKLKFELQIRTVLMHAWAEIEHNLAYKNELQTPKQFRRKLHRISAKLEEADEQFEELKRESDVYQKRLQKDTKDSKIIDSKEIELNIDSLQAYMNSNFPDRINRFQSTKSTGRLFDEMVKYDISLRDLKNAWEKIKPKFIEIESEYLKRTTKNLVRKWTQVGIARFVLDLTHDNFRKRIKSDKNRGILMELYNKYYT